MATTAGSIDRTYLSSVSFLDQREILNQVLDIKDEESTLLDFMDMLGMTKPTASEAYDSFTNDFLYKQATLTNDPDLSGGAGTVSVGAGDVKPVVGELILTKDGLTGLVTAVSGNDITVDPIDTFLETSLESGDTIVFHSNAHAEGTGANLMRVSNLTKIQNQVQIFKTKTRVTDLADGSKVEVEFDGKPYYFIKQQHDAWLKHRMDVMYGFIYNNFGSGTDANSNTVNTTRGIRNYIADYGIEQSAATPGTIVKDDFNLLGRAMDAERCPNEYIMGVGGEIDNEIEDGIANFSELKQGGIVYNAFGGGNQKQRAIDMGFDSFRLFNRTYHKQRWASLDHKEVTNPVAAYLFDEDAYLIPAGKVKSEHNGTEVDRMCVRYMEFGTGGDSRYQEFLTGGLAPVPTNDTGEFVVTYESIEGLDINTPQHFVRLDLGN
jgi:hypothetical protein